MKKNIFFDVDSTLVQIEGLDYLAKLKNIEAEIELLTSQAMNGDISMRKAMGKKIDILQPSLEDLQIIGEKYINCLVPGAIETIDHVKKMGHQVWLLTGNFRPAVMLLAEHLDIAKENVLANEIIFDKNNHFKSIDLNHPLSNNNGKAEMIKKLGNQVNNRIMIGDGATDLDTKPVVDLFIGFGGVTIRPQVKKEAEVYIENLDLREILVHI